MVKASNKKKSADLTKKREIVSGDLVYNQSEKNGIWEVLSVIDWHGVVTCKIRLVRTSIILDADLGLLTLIEKEVTNDMLNEPRTCTTYSFCKKAIRSTNYMGDKTKSYIKRVVSGNSDLIIDFNYMLVVGDGGNEKRIEHSTTKGNYKLLRTGTIFGQQYSFLGQMLPKQTETIKKLLPVFMQLCQNEENFMEVLREKFNRD